MRKTLLIVLTLCVALCAISCQAPSDPSPTPVLTVSPLAPDPTTPAASVSTPAPPDAIREAYRAALETLKTDHVLPDGTDCGYDPSCDVTDNQFALLDVDQDGREELVVAYTTTYTAGQIQCVFDADPRTDLLYAQLSEYPLMTFYDNGVVTVGWSHNQGYAGAFWPYNLYRYQEQTDAYALVASVDAWDKSVYAEGFPEASDVSGTGIVYYVTPAGETSSEPMDLLDYTAWREQMLSGATEMRIDYQPFTDEKIAQVR